MNQINFLPAIFAQERRRRQRVFRQGVLMALVGLAIVLWLVNSRGQLDDLRGYARDLELEAITARTQISELSKLQTQHRVLAHQVQIQRELAQPIALSQTIATLGHLTPEDVSLTQLIVVAKRPAPAPPIAPDAKSAAPARKKAQPAAPAPEVLRLELVGLAPSDLEITTFFGHLVQHPLFANVKLLYSRGTQVGEHSARDFRIELEVPLDREYKLTPANPTEVAHAP